MVRTQAATPPNFQKFTGSLGGFFAPAVNQGGRGYVVHNDHSGASFVDLPTALQRSCGNQTIAASLRLLERETGCGRVGMDDALTSFVFGLAVHEGSVGRAEQGVYGDAV